MALRPWIQARTGRDRCAACEHPHHLHVSYRCVGCDGEVCALCVIVVRRTGRRLCPACHAEEEA